MIALSSNSFPDLKISSVAGCHQILQGEPPGLNRVHFRAISLECKQSYGRRLSVRILSGHPGFLLEAGPALGAQAFGREQLDGHRPAKDRLAQANSRTERC